MNAVLSKSGFHFILPPSSLILSLRRLRRSRGRVGLRGGVRHPAGGRVGRGLLLLRGVGRVYALAQALDFGVGRSDRGFEPRVARGQKFELLLYARALALQLLRDGVAHGRRV